MAFQQDVEALKSEVLELERTVLELDVMICDGPEIDRIEILTKHLQELML